MKNVTIIAKGVFAWAFFIVSAVCAVLTLGFVICSCMGGFADIVNDPTCWIITAISTWWIALVLDGDKSEIAEWMYFGY